MALFSFLNTAKWNKEPAQIELATMLGYAAQSAVRGEATGQKEAEIIKFLVRSGWRKNEASDRLIHACSMVKRAGSPAVYAEGKRIAEALYQSLRASW